MIRVDIESIVMASGPVPSVVVLRERKNGATPMRPCERCPSKPEPTRPPLLAMASTPTRRLRDP